MTTNKTRTLANVLRGVAVLFLVVAFVLLPALRGRVVTEEEAWGIKTSNYTRVDLDSEYTYSSANYFGRIEKLNMMGYSTGLEVAAVVFLGLAVVAVVVSIVLKSPKKVFLAPVVLAAAALLIAVMIDNDTRYVYGHKTLGTVLGYTVHTQYAVTFKLIVIPSIILIFFAFVLTLAGGLLEMMAAKKAAVAFQYGQPQYGQPQYGQPQYGQPQYGQPQYGQPQYGQPQYGQPQYGQPQYGQPQYGQPQYGQPQYGQPQYGQPQYGQPQYAQPQYAQPVAPVAPAAPAAPVAPAAPEAPAAPAAPEQENQ